jgi:HAE1 family hydrophobic/amphiphilic exporter-1
MSIIERSVRQPVTITVVVLLVVIFGLLGFLRVPVQLTPNVDQPVVSVTTRWIGASPQEIEQEILEEQEEVLKTAGGLREMTSEAFEGQGLVRLEFYVGVDKEAALNEVRDKLGRVPEYPQEVDRPIVESVDSGSRDWIAWILVRPVNNDPANLQAGHGFNGDVTELETFLRDYVKPELERGEGVKDVQVFGGREKEMQVRVDLQRLASRGITIDQFVDALRQENLNVSAGAIAQGKRDVSVRAIGQYDSPEQINATVVGWSAAGAPVYVSDVADVGIGFKRRVSFVRSEGEEVMALNAKRETDTNVLEVMRNLKRQIAKVNRDVLGPRGWGLELHQVYDQTVYVDRSVRQASDDLVIGALLAAAVLFLTLRSLGATLVVAVSIPISVIGTFLGMALTGRNLNVISMAGLSFAIGMGVDNTIVVLENIFRHREMGKNRLQAAMDGAAEVWGAIVAATLANIAVFLPVVFIREEAGQLFRDISMAISISLFLYAAVSPTVIPMLAAMFLRKMPGGFVERGEEMTEAPTATRLGKLTRSLSRRSAQLSRVFYALVLWLTHGVARRVVLIVGMIGIAMIGAYALIPPRTYLPTGNQNLIFAFVLTPPGYSVDELRDIAHHVEAVLRPWWQAKPGSEELRELQQEWTQSRDQVVVPALQQQIEGLRAAVPAEAFETTARPLREEIAARQRSPAPAGIDNFFFVIYQGNVFMGATSQDPQNVDSLKYLFTHATQGIAGTFAIAQQASIFDLGDSFGQTVDVSIAGQDYDKVRAAAAVVQGMMVAQLNSFPVPNPQHFNIGRLETQVHPDRARAAAAGITTSSMRRAVQVAVDGEVIGDYREGAKSIDLTVMSKQASAQGVEALRDIPLATRAGRVIPLSAVATFLHTDAPQRIRRIEEQPAVALSLSLNQNQTVQEVEAAVRQGVIMPLQQQGVLTPDLSVRTTGSAAKLSQFMRAFVPGFILAVVVTYLLLAALFESWLHPFVIIMSVPFALVGGFFGLWLLHVTTGALLDVLTMLGFVILIGTIVNNPILIVHQALNYMREGMDHREAIGLSTQTRVRPIFMSVVTSVAGMSPLVLLGGAGSELYRGLGSVVIGGLLVSTVFTLILTPALMSLMLDLQAWIHRWRHRSRGVAHAGRSDHVALPSLTVSSAPCLDEHQAVDSGGDQPAPLPRAAHGSTSGGAVRKPLKKT